MLHKMTNMRSETKPKAFWNMLKKIFPKVKVDSKNIPAQNFSQYYKKLLNTRRTLDIPPDEEKVGELDYSISLDELKKASSILKPGKALGIDNIGNEMTICLVGSCPSIILKVFNLILQTCGIIPDWGVGAIVPIFKKGSKAEPFNYRGITLLPCLGKLFITILNNRLMKFVIDRNILAASQLGFISGNRTSDTHIIINNLVRIYIRRIRDASTLEVNTRASLKSTKGCVRGV